ETELEQYQLSLSIAGKNGSTIEILLVLLLWLEYQDVPMAVEGEDAATAAPVEGISSVVLFGWKAIVNKGLGQGRGEKSGSAYNGVVRGIYSDVEEEAVLTLRDGWWTLKEFLTSRRRAARHQQLEEGSDGHRKTDGEKVRQGTKR
ncbi:hypothetical protein BHM03_00054441, partial [Ensete ventricosum]